MVPIPIQHWLTIPMMHFEPPAMCVRRFWIGLQRLAADHPGARLVVATHSGPIRAFAIWALGYDPGEPYNTEHVRVKLMEGGREATRHLPQPRPRGPRPRDRVAADVAPRRTMGARVNVDASPFGQNVQRETSVGETSDVRRQTSERRHRA